MEIKILGKNTIISKEEMRYMLNFFGDILLGKRLSKHIYLEVENTDFDDNNEMGYCNYTDYGYGKHREFTIELNRNLPYDQQVDTLAHEMVHVKQFARNEWKMYEKEGLYSWMGKRMYIPDNKYSERYRKLPWEKEAYLSEPWLAGFYQKHCNKNSLEW